MKQGVASCLSGAPSASLERGEPSRSALLATSGRHLMPSHADSLSSRWIMGHGMLWLKHDPPQAIRVLGSFGGERIEVTTSCSAPPETLHPSETRCSCCWSRAPKAPKVVTRSVWAYRCCLLFSTRSHILVVVCADSDLLCARYGIGNTRWSRSPLASFWPKCCLCATSSNWLPSLLGVVHGGVETPL